MVILQAFVFVIVSVGALSLSRPDQLPLNHIIPSFELRAATEADLDDITTTYIDAFAPAREHRYISLDAAKFANYTWHCTREGLGREFKHLPDTAFANVISVPCDNARGERVVSFGYWKVLEVGSASVPTQIDFLTRLTRFADPEHGSDRCAEHLDVNITRVLDYARQNKVIEDKYIYGLGQSQLNLYLLATHPDWDGNGFGARQVLWGEAQARQRGWPATLISSPVGYPLYDSLGWKSVANVTIQMLDGLGNLWFEYMRWNA